MEMRYGIGNFAILLRNLLYYIYVIFNFEDILNINLPSFERVIWVLVEFLSTHYLL